MINLKCAEVKVTTEQVEEYDYNWSLDDRINHIHVMTRSGYTLKSVWSDGDGHHASFSRSTVQCGNNYDIKTAQLIQKKIEELYHITENTLGSVIDIKA